ncbi:hypothetical protein CORC01_10989 [Colletotrichum orchidophilum]|uniref:Uncharacterized protein n=1 Tax=Colletotrichum orchidophilum TaxID=1209926 RepID=A0A1G4AX95_9PEZI|nr:uncharacterized protein CORC01_10989 [Colletotrichum orchidophilum]OHE93672.1 hypothetical protein CORC01_10989 [Colletotrichum orchidophilum]
MAVHFSGHFLVCVLPRTSRTPPSPPSPSDPRKETGDILSVLCSSARYLLSVCQPSLLFPPSVTPFGHSRRPPLTKTKERLQSVLATYGVLRIWRERERGREGAKERKGGGKDCAAVWC